MAVSITIKRGTRAQIEAAAGSASLSIAEPYLITDEDRLAVGTRDRAFVALAKQSEVPSTSDLDYGLITASPTSTADYGSIA